MTMTRIDVIPFGTSEGEFQGTVEVALAASGDLLLTALSDQDKPQADFYVTPANAKRLADALLNGINRPKA